MASKTLNTLDVPTTEHWRKWLLDHHETESEVWLVFYKKDSAKASIPYLDALDEALCFGWIDSLIKSLDDRRYARKFTSSAPAESKGSKLLRKSRSIAPQTICPVDRLG